MTNPNNAVGTNAAYGGRTSVDAFNDDLAVYSRGVLSGWACSPDSGLTVVLGGNGNTRDVAIAEDNAGNKTTINNVSGSPVSVTIGAAPGSNTRIDSIVAYVDASPQGTATIADNYEACGLIVVQGTASSSPVAPTENAIRSAITADGASGATAYYVVLATVTIASGTTDITADDITAGSNAMIRARNIDFTTFGGGASIDNNVTLSNAGAYNYKVITGLETTINTEIGGTYGIILTVSIKPSVQSEIYITSAVDGARFGGQVIQYVSGGTYRNMAATYRFTATSNTHTIVGMCCAGDPASTSLEILKGAAINIFRIS